jgi:integrase
MSVYRRPETGQWRYDFWQGGQRFSGSLEAKSKKEAEAKELRIRSQAQIDQEEQRKTGKIVLTLDAAARRYWDEKGQHHTDDAKTFTDLERLVAHMGPNRRLDEITDDDVVQLVAWRRAQPAKGKKGKLVAPATVNRSTTEVLKKLFTRARVVWRYSFPNEPRWNEHMLKEPEARVRELKQDEEKKLEDAMRSDYAPWVRFTLLTGLRRAETVLRWSEVDRDAKVIVTMGKGDRKVTAPITPAVEAILASVEGQHEEFVFTYAAKRTSQRAGTIRGTRYPITYEGGKTEWQRLVKRAGVKDFRFHDLRHTTATRLLRETGNLMLVKEALNHRDVTTTARYAHVHKVEVAAALQKVAETHAHKTAPTTSPGDCPPIDPAKPSKTGT